MGKNKFSFEDADFDELTDNLGAKEIEETEPHDYDVTDVADGKNHATEKEVVEAQLECDPGAATESYISHITGLSSEDLDELSETTVEEADSEEVVVSGGVDGDDEMDVTVEEGEDETTVTVNPDCDENCEVTLEVSKEGEEEESEIAVAATESFRRIMGIRGREDTEDENNDVNFNVEVPGKSDFDIGIDDKAVTIEPNDVDTDEVPDLDDDVSTDDGSDDMGDDATDTDTGADEGSGDAEASGESADEGEDESGDDENSEESWSFN